MALTITWSPKALQNLNSVIKYLDDNWPDTVVSEFVRRTEIVLKLIGENPTLFRRISTRNKIREAVITRHNLLLYTYNKEEITLLAVFDTRQHPRKKKIK